MYIVHQFYGNVNRKIVFSEKLRAILRQKTSTRRKIYEKKEQLMEPGKIFIKNSYKIGEKQWKKGSQYAFILLIWR